MPRINVMPTQGSTSGDFTSQIQADSWVQPTPIIWEAKEAPAGNAAGATLITPQPDMDPGSFAFPDTSTAFSSLEIHENSKNTTPEMSTKNYIVTLKDTASTEDVHGLKLKISEQGGQVLDEFSLIKGFLVKLNQPVADFIKDHHVVNSIEEDKEVKIQ